MRLKHLYINGKFVNFLKIVKEILNDEDYFTTFVV